MKAIMNVNLTKQAKREVFYGAVMSLILLIFGANQAYAAGVSLSATPNTQTVTVGQTAIYTIKINRDGFADKVTLSATGLPAGVTVGFMPNTTTAKSSTLKLQTSANTPIGIFKITVKGTANGITIAPITVKLTTTAAQAISISTFPQSQSIVAGQKTYYDIQINRTGFKGPVVLSVENLPANVKVVFEPQETEGDTSRMWLYSNGLPSFPQSFGMNVVARGRDFELLYGLKVIKLNVNCDIVWGAQGFVEYNGSPDFATAITSDRAGNIYAAGYFFTVATGATEVWVAKYSPTGTKIWVSTVTLNPVVGSVAGLEKRVKAIAVDNPPITNPPTLPNIYIAGYTQTGMPVNFDAFIAKFDNNGNQLGDRVFGNNNAEDGEAMEFSFDARNQAVLTAAMNVRRQFISNGFGGTVIHAFYDINRMVFNSNVGIASDVTLVRDVVGDPKDLTVGTGGEIYVVGRELNFNPVQYFGWARKYNSNGGQTYNQSFATDFIPSRVAADSSGNAFVAGDTLRSTGGIPSQDVWLAKLATNGSRQWMNFDATPETETIGDLTTDTSGNVIYSGSTTGDLAAANPDSNSDAWLAKRGSTGALFFLRQFAVSNKDNFEAIALDNAGNALVAGNTVTFNNVNYGYEDVLLVKYSLNALPFALFITRPNPASVRRGTQFTIEGGNFFGVTGIYFDGQPIPFTVVSSTRITATAPNVPASRTASLIVSANCAQQSSPIQLTVTP